MKTFFRSVAMLLGLGLLPVAAHAQKKVIIEDEEPNSVMFVSTNKAGDEIIRIMNETRLPRFHEPKAPRFVLTDRQGKFAKVLPTVPATSSRWISALPPSS